jgi:hypothetical protein
VGVIGLAPKEVRQDVVMNVNRKGHGSRFAHMALLMISAARPPIM